jgi:hypothetical protein
VIEMLAHRTVMVPDHPFSPRSNTWQFSLSFIPSVSNIRRETVHPE